MTLQENNCAEPGQQLEELQKSYNSLKETLAHEIADRKRVEEEFRQHEKRFHLMLDYSSDILVFLDKDGYQRYISPSAATITGFSIEELQTSFLNVVHPDDVERVKSAFEDLIRNPESILKGEYRHLHKNGGFRYFEAIGRNYLEDKELQGLVINIRDITDRKLADLALREKELNYHLLADNMTDTVWLMDMNLKFVYISPSVEKVRGFTLSELQQLSLDQILTPDSYKSVIEVFTKLMPEIQSDPNFSPIQTMELEFYDKDGNKHVLETRLSIIRDNKGNPTNILGLDRDVSERKAIENALKASELSMEEAQEIGKMGSWEYDLSYNKLIWSKNLYRVFGYEPFQISPTYELFISNVHPNDRHLIREAGEFVNDNKKLISQEFRLLTPDGTVKWINNKLVPVFEENKLVKLKGVSIDITELKRTEDLLEQTHKNYETFFNTIDDFLFILDEQGNIIHANSTVFERLGYTDQELYGHSVFMVHPTDRREEAGKIVGQMLKGEVEFCPVPVVTKAGVQIPVETRISHGYWDDKPALFGVTKDISELRLSEEKFSKLFFVNPSACGLSDLDSQKYIEVNDVFYSLFGYNKGEVIGKTASELGILPEDTRTSILSVADKSGKIRNAYADLIAKNGDIKHVLLSAENILVQDRNYRFTVVHDITQLKKVEKELIVAKEKAEESDRLKSAFLANMSHEIRTPMNGILGFSQLLQEPKLSGQEQQEYISMIQKSGKRMINIINDIVDISKIESGLVELSLSETNISEQIAYIHDFFTPEAAKKGIHFSIKNRLRVEESIIVTDIEKLNAILTNLLSNALKFTRKGLIEVGVEKKDYYLEFFVKDTGIGVSDQQKEIIFQRFRQGNDLRSRYNEGAGLGLAISKAYVELLGGKIWISGKQGEGSIFVFTIPFRKGKGAIPELTGSTSEIISDNPTQNLKILIAEDDEESQNLIKIVLEKFGKQFLVANTGAEAVEICANTPDINLVLMDVRMPEMDGYTATRKIREFNKDLIIIAQTAYGLTGDKEKAIKAGCNDYIPKPIIIEDLKALIQKYFPV